MSVSILSRHEARTYLPIPCYLGKVPAGFPSPADDYMDRRLDLNEHLIKHPAATIYCIASGVSLTGIGIFDGDMLIVDRSLEAKHKDVVLVSLYGELTCKILDIQRQCLRSANRDYPPIPIPDGADFEIEGVIIHSIRSHRVRPG